MLKVTKSALTYIIKPYIQLFNSKTVVKELSNEPQYGGFIQDDC